MSRIPLGRRHEESHWATPRNVFVSCTGFDPTLGGEFAHTQHWQGGIMYSTNELQFWQRSDRPQALGTPRSRLQWGFDRLSQNLKMPLEKLLDFPWKHTQCQQPDWSILVCGTVLASKACVCVCMCVELSDPEGQKKLDYFSWPLSWRLWSSPFSTTGILTTVPYNPKT